MNTPAFAESQARPPLVGFEFQGATMRGRPPQPDTEETERDEIALEIAARHAEMTALENGWGYGPS